jgi:hypothetical protein
MKKLMVLMGVLSMMVTVGVAQPNRKGANEEYAMNNSKSKTYSDRDYGNRNVDNFGRNNDYDVNKDWGYDNNWNATRRGNRGGFAVNSFQQQAREMIGNGIDEFDA